MTRQTSKTPKPEPILKGSGSTQVEKLISFTERSMRDYGIEVVEKRAIPDFRDGLKPVHRCILWAMYKLGLHHTAQFKKAARTVGECFVAGTPVLTTEGIKPIELVRIGDIVVTDCGNIPVIELFAMPKKQVAVIHMKDGSVSPAATLDQIFFTSSEDGSLVEVKLRDIKPGMKLFKKK